MPLPYVMCCWIVIPNGANVESVTVLLTGMAFCHESGEERNGRGHVEAVIVRSADGWCLLHASNRRAGATG